MSFQDFKDNTTRALVSKTIDGVLHYVNKDRQKNLLKLVDISEKLMGDKFRKEVFEGARNLINDPDSKWMKYANRILDEIDPHVMDETESPELAYSGGFGAGYGSYSTNVPGGRSGYSGASRGYLNSEYNRGGFGSKYAGGFQSGFASGGHESPNYPGGRHTVQSSSFGAGYGSSRVNHHSGAPVAPAGGGVTTAPAAPARKKAANFAAGDLVDHKVFGRGKVLKVTPVAGDCIVEIQFDRVGIKKTMANYAPLTKLTSEE